MKYSLLIILSVIFLQLHAQKRQCYCDKDTMMNHATTNCNIRKLSNNSKLYWQYNCDKIWLTLENRNGTKVILDTVEKTLYGYTSRLGYHLIKEFQNNLLFRSGCPANGSCIYTLINKDTGKKIKEFGQLICIDTDIQYDNPHKYNHNFVVYLSNTSDHLIIEFINTNKKLKIPFKFLPSQIIPEYQFKKLSLKGNILTISYEENNLNKKFLVDINSQKYLVNK